jgi:hypothetical protein
MPASTIVRIEIISLMVKFESATGAKQKLQVEFGKTFMQFPKLKFSCLASESKWVQPFFFDGDTIN